MTYPTSYRERAELLRAEHSVREIAAVLGVHRDTIYRWRRPPKPSSGPKVQRRRGRRPLEATLLKRAVLALRMRVLREPDAGWTTERLAVTFSRSMQRKAPYRLSTMTKLLRRFGFTRIARDEWCYPKAGELEYYVAQREIALAGPRASENESVRRFKR